ncbi:MAG: carboxypeptidase regulatory-like domain-containing protein, partial [Longimicrobiales bacterium]
MKHLRFIALAALVALPLMACSDDEKEPTGPITGTITGTVTVEGTPQDGVTINLVGPTSGSATTSLAGTFEFTNVEAGSYAVLIEDSPTDDVIYAGLSKNVTITTEGQIVTVDFAGSYIRTSTISGNVTADGEGLAGVPVTLAGPEADKNAVTDGSGHYSVSGLRAGDYTVTIDPPEEYNFEQTSLNVSVAVGSLTEASFFGERGVQEVTASLVISKVTKNDGTLVDPDNITGQINVTVQIDPGENKLTRVCVLLAGTEVRNGCQA